MEEPNFLDFLDYSSGDVDYGAYILASEEWENLNIHKRQRLHFKIPKNRTANPRVDWRQCKWFQEYIVKDLFEDPDSRNGKLFRKRFFFQRSHVIDIANRMRAEGIHDDTKTDAIGRICIPLELLILGVLRILTRNWVYDDIMEQINISETAMRSFFEKFVFWYSDVIFKETVVLPKVEDLDMNGIEYARAGFPGCLGSIDCVHVRLWNCAANLKQVASGKEKFPSRAFEVMVNHRRMILSCTDQGFHGSYNDKTIVKFDGAMIKIRDGLYAEYEYNIYEEDGEIVTMKGAYTINDNGYLNWGVMMEPSKHPENKSDEYWSEMCESLRKDVECTFGVLKQCFAILKYGMRMQSLAQVDAVFKTCCAMYNQRMVASGKDSPWVDFTDIDNDLNDAIDEDAPNIYYRVHVEGIERIAMHGMGPGDGAIIQEYPVGSLETIAHDERKKRLINHFYYAYKNAKVVWPRDGKVSHVYNALEHI
jgi:hypothetical protein